MIISKKGYRLSIGIILMNAEGKLFWGRRLKQKNAWQFPQGGILPYETAEEAMYREMGEEIGLVPADVKLLGVTRNWIYYNVPLHLRRYFQKPVCIGQQQKWFLLRLLADESKICLEQETPEFDEWCWVDYWYPMHNVIFFKRQVYRKALRELFHCL